MKDQVPTIDFSWRAVYLQALQLVQCFDIDPGTSNTAALLSILFQSQNLYNCQTNLRDWLYEYVTPFVLNPIRNEQNQTEKILAVASFIYLSKPEMHDKALPGEQSIDYIEYAEKQSWLNDSFLAFYCHFLREKLVSCEKSADYFKTNYELFLQKKHIPGISQSLIVLQNDYASTDNQRGYDLLIELMNQKEELTDKNMSWALWAFSVHPKTYKAEIRQLSSLIENKILELLKELDKENSLSAISALIAMGSNENQIESYIKKLNKTSTSKIEVTQKNRHYQLNIKSRDQISATYFSLNDLVLMLIAFNQAKQDKIAYVDNVVEDQLQTLEKSLKIFSSGNIVMSRGEKNIANISIVVLTILIGMLVLFIQIGSPLKVGDASFNWDFWVALVIWLDYLVAEIRAVKAGSIATDAIKGIPLLRLVLSASAKPKRESDL